jgi:hypothetical protein
VQKRSYVSVWPLGALLSAVSQGCAEDHHRWYRVSDPGLGLFYLIESILLFNNNILNFDLPGFAAQLSAGRLPDR